MLACPSSSVHGLATLQRHSQPSHFLLSKPLFFSPSPRLAASRKCNIRSLPSGRNSRRSVVRASTDSPEALKSVVGGDGGVLQPYSVKIPVGDRHILVETGHIGRQASGSVTVTDGETILYTTVCLDDVPSEPSDFFPLSVNYQERFSAAGRTRLIDRPLRPIMPKGFYHETQILSWVLSYDGLHSPDSLAVTAAGIAVALSEVPMSKAVAGVRVGLVGDKYIVNPTIKEMEHSELDLLLAGTDSAILMIEGYSNFLPEEQLLKAVEVGQDAVRAICNEVEALVKKCGKPKMLDAIKLPPPELYEHVEFLDMIDVCESVIGKMQINNRFDEYHCGKTVAIMAATLNIKMAMKTVGYDEDKRGNEGHRSWIETYVGGNVQKIAGDEIVKVLQISNKIPRRKALSSLEEKVLKILTENGFVTNELKLRSNSENIGEILEDEDEDEEVIVDGEVDEGDVHIKLTSHKPALLFSEVDVKLVFKEVTSKFLRKRIVQGGKRSDGRTPNGIRPINSRCGLLPRAHGSALFTRGETQSLAVVTLGDKQMAQRIDCLDGDDELKRFYLQYSFPPSCVGEVGRIGAPSRREIGHGMLAERSLERILPSDNDFPYTIRVESTITESNGSSSMASVCGACLALQDAGVPIKCSIAGIAMGMVLDTKEFGGDGTPLILSDIIGSEDASGDMDFKVAGNEDGVTAFQMDIKVGGVTLPIMRKALLQARDGRKHILEAMMNCSPPPANKLSKYAPLIHVMKVKPDRVNLIIGSGGKKVKSIIEESGVEAIDADDNGIVKIFAKDLLSLEKSKAIISSLAMVPSVGDIYRNCEIKSIASYGVFVEIAPGREGLCHISELSSGWLPKAEDVFKVGDRIDVKLIEINEKGQLRLSYRALLPDTDADNSNVKPTGELADDTETSPKSPEKSKDKSSTPKITASSKRSSEDDSVLPSKKFIKRLVSSSQDKPFTNKDKTKKSSNKAVGSVSGKDESSLVSGEA
ncbi:unnamed protein product [Sphenostylis stenocarpa]|uniref:polyribonucleotide nucleotidyltransferase n=1 Tax=Sphenostylis stenocarpa TaxID=92480 RepID=A0AA86RYZ4_9FABA|nr:unnamed protein product [Sphenostylis stenocarpa]